MGSSAAVGQSDESGVGRRQFASTAGLVAGVMGLGYAVFAQGGFYPHQFRWLVLVLAVGALAGLVAVPPRREDLVSPLIGLSVPLLIWSVCRAVAAGSIRGAAPAAGLLICIGALALIVGRLMPADRLVFEVGVLAIGVLAGLDGWYGVAWHHRPAALTDQGLWRAASPITYANGTAGLLVPLALFALGRTIDGRSVRLREQVARNLSAYLLLCGAAATLSRAGGIALVAGFVVLGLVAGLRRLARTGGPVLVGSAIALVGLLPSTPAGSRTRPALALLCLVLGAVVVVVAVLAGGSFARTGASLVAVAAMALVAVALVVTVVAMHQSEFSGALRRIRSVRLTATSIDRADEWQATWRLIRDRPVVGIGPGQFRLVFPTQGGRTVMDRYAHNEYLQLFAEEGGVGLALLAGGLVLVVTGLIRAWRRRRPEAGAGLAALAAIGVHSAFDFLWHIPAVVLLPLALICLALIPDAQPADGCQILLASADSPGEAVT